MFASRVKKGNALNPYGSQIMSKWIHIRAIRKRTLWCCVVWCVLYSSRCRDGHRCVQNWPDWIGLCILLYMYTLFIWPHVQYSGECVITFVCKRGETKWTPETKFFIFEKIPRKSRTHTKVKNSKPKTRRYSNNTYKWKKGKKKKKRALLIWARRVSESEMNWMCVRYVLHIVQHVRVSESFTHMMICYVLYLCMWWKCGWTLLRCRAMSVSRT